VSWTETTEKIHQPAGQASHEIECSRRPVARAQLSARNRARRSFCFVLPDREPAMGTDGRVAFAVASLALHQQR
jgi:hypothetical protein